MLGVSILKRVIQFGRLMQKVYGEILKWVVKILCVYKLQTATSRCLSCELLKTTKTEVMLCVCYIDSKTKWEVSRLQCNSTSILTHPAGSAESTCDNMLPQLTEFVIVRIVMISFQEFQQWFRSTATVMKDITFIILSLIKLAIITSVQKLWIEEGTSAILTKWSRKGYSVNETLNQLINLWFQSVLQEL
jgi:hypothetical protein